MNGIHSIYSHISNLAPSEYCSKSRITDKLSHPWDDHGMYHLKWGGTFEYKQGGATVNWIRATA